MKKNWKRFERVVWMIQETLKDDETRVSTNRKLPDKSGNLREIDVLVEGVINGFSVRIAIECKDYTNPVSVDRIDAFAGKCSMIDGIDKKVLPERCHNFGCPIWH